jgi:hypothetical protein
LTRKQDINLPRKVGNKLKFGTLGQYLITFCLSFFFQSFGINPIAAGLYAGTGGTIGNQLQKIANSKMSEAELEQAMNELVSKFDEYKDYTNTLEYERERRIIELIAKSRKETVEETETALLKQLGIDPAKVESTTIQTIKSEVVPAVSAIVSMPIPADVKDKLDIIEMSFDEAKALLRKAQKKVQK